MLGSSTSAARPTSAAPCANGSKKSRHVAVTQGTQSKRTPLGTLLQRPCPGGSARHSARTCPTEGSRSAPSSREAARAGGADGWGTRDLSARQTLAWLELTHAQSLDKLPTRPSGDFSVAADPPTGRNTWPSGRGALPGIGTPPGSGRGHRQPPPDGMGVPRTSTSPRARPGKEPEDREWHADPGMVRPVPASAHCALACEPH